MYALAKSNRPAISSIVLLDSNIVMHIGTICCTWSHHPPASIRWWPE
jgi:hypothetical protein